MGFLSKLRWSADVLSDPAPRFAVDEDAIDPAVFGLTSYASPTSPAPRIDRKSAIQVPAVKRARDLIAGALGLLPLELTNPAGEIVVSSLLEQPERNVPRSVTMTRTIEDMLFEKVAWWRVVEFGWHTYPVFVEHITPVSRVTVADKAPGCDVKSGCSGAVSIDGKHVHDTEVIALPSPNDALLVAGARAIRTCLSLESAVYRYADEPMPLGYFTPKADAPGDPTEPEVTQLLDSWADARRRRANGYIPRALDYKAAQFSPEAMQLDEAREAARLEVALLAGIDPEEVGVSTTSRTYSNQFDRRKAFTDFTLGAYRAAIQDRLSMGDVTPRGYRVRFNLDEFLRSDPGSFYTAVKAGIEVGAILPEEVRPMVGKAPADAQQLPARDAQEAPVSASQPAALEFSDDVVIRLDAPGASAFEVDTTKRTITGLLVPYGVPARSGGQLWQFSKGTLKYGAVSRIKLWIQHDQNRAVGVATELDDRDDGMYGTFRVARGAAGDEALSYAEDGVLDGFSIGLSAGGKFTTKDGVNHAVEAPWMETSLTPAPAFDDARVHSVAASADKEGTTMFTEEELASLRAAGIDPSNVDAARAFLRGQSSGFSAAGAQDFTALTGTITDAIAAGFADLRQPQVPGREHVAAGGTFEVREELPYRFSGSAGEHSLIDDLRSMHSGDTAARQRLETFMDEAGAAFAVTTGNVATLNPTQTRPELFVPNLTYTAPLQESISTGSIDDKTPFTVPKFGTVSGLVGAHTEGVEPTPGTFTATSQTITPGALSGKIEINREVWDQGGSPQADAIIWGEMLNAWSEAREARIATLLNGLTLTETNLASAVDEALVDAVSNIFIDLQFVRGGNRYTRFVSDGLLFKALANASDTSGRKLLPILGAQNAQGSVDGGFSAVQLGTTSVKAAWALGATNASHSYLFVPSSVWQWASTPKRFTFEYQVKSIDMAIWGYEANAVLRDSDVKRIDYTTADV